MINALLVLALVGQDADITVTGHGRRIGGEYELTVAGKGKGLPDQEIVSLKFRRLANRIRWEDGLLVTAPVEEEICRAATAADHAFVHRERFAVPDDVEVRIARSHPDGAPAGSGEVRRVFRTASLPEQAHALGSAAKRFDGALRGVKMILDDLDAIRDDMCPHARKQAHLQKRIDWRKNAYRQEIADSFLGASARALTQVMSDIDVALDLERNGKETTSMVSSLTGKPFSWEETRELLAAIEAVSLRERALRIVKAAEAIAQETAAVRSGDAGAWARAEKEFTRALDALEDQDQAWRTGPSAEAYLAAVDAAGAGLDGFLSFVREVLKAGAACIHGGKPDEGHFAELGQSLMDQAGTFETRVRSRK